MSQASIQECEDCMPPAEAFSAVGNETRLAILEALWEAEERPVSFSELRKAVEMRDSAQFNYHLQQLTDHFVVGTDDGYDFRNAGEKVVRAVLAGSFNQHPDLDPFEIDGTCAVCGASLQAVYRDEHLKVECTECGHGHGEYSFPPGGLNDRTRGEVMDAFDQRVRHLHCLAADGVCPECNGKMETEIIREGECCLAAAVRVEHTCAQCDHTLCSPVGLSLLDQSDVVAFHRDHGVALCSEPYWNLEWVVSDEFVTVRSEDPWRIEVGIQLDDERLRVTMDGDLAVLDVTRERSATEEAKSAV